MGVSDEIARDGDVPIAAMDPLVALMRIVTGGDVEPDHHNLALPPGGVRSTGWTGGVADDIA